MRKMTVRGRIKPDFISPFEKVLEDFESFEMLDLLKVDFEKGEKIGLVEVQLKEGLDLESVHFPEGYEIIGILKQEGNRYTLLGKVQAPKNFISLFKKFDLNIIWTPPMGRTKDGFVASVIGNDDELRKFLSAIKSIGDDCEVTFPKTVYEPTDVLSNLTEKQREIVVAAKKMGYYDYPRQVNAGELAKELGISKSTVLEHLRKAEGKIVSLILV